MQAFTPQKAPEPHSARTLCRGLVALAMALSLLVPRTAPGAHQEEPTAADADRRLMVDTSALDPDASRAITGRIRSGVGRAIRLFEEYGGAELDPSVELEVHVAPLAGGAPGYRVAVAGRSVGSQAASTRAPFDCPACTETELVDRVVEAVGLLLPELQPTPTRDPSQPEPMPGTGAVDPEPHDENEQPGPVPRTAAAEPTDEPPGLSCLAKAGIAGTVVGGVGVAVGLGLGLREDTPSGGEFRAETVSTKPVGWSLVGVGAAVLVVGVALLARDRIRSRRALQRSSHARAATVVPQLWPHGAGLGVELRY